MRRTEGMLCTWGFGALTGVFVAVCVHAGLPKVLAQDHTQQGPKIIEADFIRASKFEIVSSEDRHTKAAQLQLDKAGNLEIRLVRVAESGVRSVQFKISVDEKMVPNLNLVDSSSNSTWTAP